MSFIDAITDAIANPQRVRLSQERASARTYAHLEPKMRATRNTSPEYMRDVYSTATHHSSSSFSSRPRSRSRSPSPPSLRPPSMRPSSQASSRPSSRPPSDRSAPSISSTRPSRPIAQLHRSHSEVPLQVQREFTPDITAMRLTPDQIQKTYSSDDLGKWDPSKDPLPPLNTMSGFGRYRVAVNADPQWRLQHMRRQVKDIEHLQGMTANLDMEAVTGLSNEDWQAFTGSGSRRGSTVSSLGTKTDSSTSPLEPGRRVTLGFSPSGSSSRSSQTGYTHLRKGSSLSTMNLPDEIGSPPTANPLKRTSTMLSERRGSANLSTIEELHATTAMVTEGRCKIERPCEFADKGDLDSAVASDAEDDEAWTDVAETQPSQVSAITQMLKEEKIQQQPQTALTRVRTSSSDKKRTRGSIANLDRSRTIRAPRPDPTRRQSKSKSMHEKGTSDSKKSNESADEETAEATDKSPPGLEIKIANPIKTEIACKPSKEMVIDEAIKTLTLLDGEKSTAQRSQSARNRSATTILRVDPTTERNAQPGHIACGAK